MSVVGNANAAKFTEDEAVEALEACAQSLVSGEHATVQHALRAHGLSSGLKHYWKADRFKESASVLDAIKTLDYIAEDSLWIAGADNAMPANLCMFGLKAIHGWVEKAEAMKVDATKSVLQFEAVKADDIEKRIADISAELDNE